MKTLLLLLFMGLSLFLNAQPETSKNDLDTKQVKGTWMADLRPTPESAPYLKEFTISLKEDKFFGGTFYDTEFSNGIFNLKWDKLYFAFTTFDRNNQYFHAGYFEGDKIYGLSYSSDRQLMMPWTAVRKEP